MLPAGSRMRRRRDFEIAVRRGRRAGRPLLVGHLGRRTDGAQVPRVGLVVSRAVGNAPTRNRVRRRLRHLAADRLHQLPADARLVVRANPKAARASFADLATDLDMVLHRLTGQQPERTGAS